MKYPKTQKSCGTCSMWQGKREFDWKSNSCVFEPTEKGKCVFKGANWMVPMNSLLICQSWDCWGPLK